MLVPQFAQLRAPTVARDLFALLLPELPASTFLSFIFGTGRLEELLMSGDGEGGWESTRSRSRRDCNVLL